MIFFSSRCLEYASPGHPESPERVKRTYEYLLEKGYRFKEAIPCSEQEVLLVHTQKHIERIKRGSFFDPDTPNLKNIYGYALLSAGGALQALEEALKGKRSFSLLRPPGHHAGRNYLGGFCYFNNLAIATAKCLQKRVPRVAIIDFDGHHGNGTEDIYKRQNKVLYVSFHQSPAYPGTGQTSTQNCVNFPLAPGSGEKEYMESFCKGWEKIKDFDPSIIAVSAGFDGYIKDPLLGLNLEVGTYFNIGEKIAALGKPVFAILEGGYHQDMPGCVEGFVEGAGIK